MILTSKPEDAAPPADPPESEAAMGTDFWKAKFDNICLFLAMCLVAWMIIHFVHHATDSSAIAWAETTFTTILGAYIGLTQAHRLVNKSNGNGNGAAK
jgi:hypothetical protein